MNVQIQNEKRMPRYTWNLILRYDHVYWVFLSYILEMMGFLGQKSKRINQTLPLECPFLCRWMASQLVFLHLLRLRQRHPLSPLPFIHMMEMLNHSCQRRTEAQGVLRRAPQIPEGKATLQRHKGLRLLKRQEAPLWIFLPSLIFKR